MLMIRDEILSFKNMPQPFSVENYQSRIGDDLSDDDIDTKEIIKIDNAKNTRKMGELMIELREGNICDDGIYNDPWLKLNELQKMNILIDEAIDDSWRMIHDKDRKMHKKIDINKYSEIDRYTDKYTDIINGKIELLNKIGVILDNPMIEIQSKADMINGMKQKENVVIDTLKLIHKTLDEILRKWMSIISKTFRNDIFSEYDMKPDRPDTRKRNTRRKPDKQDIEKDIKPDIVKPDEPDIKKDIKLDIAKLDDKLKTKKKPDKSDDKSNTEKKKPDKSSDMDRRKNLQIFE